MRNLISKSAPTLVFLFGPDLPKREHIQIIVHTKTRKSLIISYSLFIARYVNVPLLISFAKLGTNTKLDAIMNNLHFTVD